MTTKNMKVQLRRDTASNWTTKNPTLLAGEMGIESDTKKFKFGDGVKPWTQLDYASTDSSATAWGDITGTLANQTDLSAVLDRKLEKTNFIQGSNIILTKNGNDITIAATGEISGGVEWGNVTGDIDNQVDLSNILDDLNEAVSPLKDIETKEEYKTDVVEASNGLSTGWFLNSLMTPGSKGGLLKGVYTKYNRSATAPAEIEFAIIEVDFEHSKWTTVKLLSEKVSFATGTQALFTNPVWVGPNQYVMVKTPDTGFGYVNSANLDICRTIAWLDTPEVGVEKDFYNSTYKGLTISLGLIFERTSADALVDAQTVAGMFREDRTTDVVKSEEVGTLKPNTSVLYISNKYKIPYDGKLKKLKIADNTYTENKNIQIAICGWDGTTFTVKTTPLTLTITPSTSEIVFDPEISVSANDYIGFSGPVGYTNPENPYKSYISGGGWSTLGPSFAGTFNRGEVPDGLNFELGYIYYHNPVEEVADLTEEVNALDAKVDTYDDRTTVKTISYLGNPNDVTAGGTWSIGNWCVGRFDAAPENGKITQVEFKHSVSSATTVLVGAFTKKSDSTECYLQRYVKASLPANETTIVLAEPLIVNAGEIVGTNVSLNALRYFNGTGGQGYFTGGEATTKDPQTIGQTVTWQYPNWGNAWVDVRFTFVKSEGVSEYAQENRSMIDELMNSGGTTSVSINDMNKVLLVGSSLTAAYYSPRSSSWVERVNDFVDVNIINGGISGNNIVTNMNKLIANAAYAGADHARDIKPTYIMWDDSANSTPTGVDGLVKYRQMKEIVDSFGAKLLMGSEENWAGGFNAYEHTQQAFANEVKVPYSPTGRLNQMAYPRDNSARRPYEVFASGHSSYRAISSYWAHTDLLGSLPIYKNVKMFRVRETYKSGSPAIGDLAYDTNTQRLQYWTAISPGASTAGWLPGHLDNYDKPDGSYDVTGTTNQGSSPAEETKMWLGQPLTFNKYALIEFILDKTNITKGTFVVKSNVIPTKVYMAKTINTAETYTDGFIRTTFVEVPFETTTSGDVIATIENDTLSQYELYDKVRVIVYYSEGQFNLNNPVFKDYDGNNKVYDETINYHRRKFGTEMLDVVNPSDNSWAKTATYAVAGTLPAPIANYTLYNDTLSHAELLADDATITKTVAISNPGYKKVAVRVVGQIWNKISTTRFNGTEYENSPYISNTKDDPLSLAAYKSTDYDYGIIRVTINDLISKDFILLPGWTETYFEADLTPNDTNLKVEVRRKSFVDDSYNNDDKPIFIHHVSVQEIE